MSPPDFTPNDRMNGFKIVRHPGNQHGDWFNLLVPGYKTAMAGGPLDHIAKTIRRK